MKRVRLPTDAYFPPSFRPPRGEKRRPIRGGRWNIRKYRSVRRGGFYWRAWRRGNEFPRGKTFATQAEAIEWAQGISNQELLTSRARRR